jgi:hypothetical protein
MTGEDGAASVASPTGRVMEGEPVDQVAFGRYRVLSSIGEDPTAGRPAARLTCPGPPADGGHSLQSRVEWPNDLVNRRGNRQFCRLPAVGSTRKPVGAADVKIMIANFCEEIHDGVVRPASRMPRVRR